MCSQPQTYIFVARQGNRLFLLTRCLASGRKKIMFWVVHNLHLRPPLRNGEAQLSVIPVMLLKSCRLWFIVLEFLWLFTGLLCEENINECKALPCLHNATCVDDIANYSCQCLHGYSGRFCEVEPFDACMSEPCNNAAMCIVNGLNYRWDKGAAVNVVNTHNFCFIDVMLDSRLIHVTHKTALIYLSYSCVIAESIFVC
jgi:hypothetical protein